MEMKTKEITAVLVEDEQPAMERLERMISELAPFIKVAGRAGNGPAAAEVVNRVQPELVFLDINIPGEDGISVINRFLCRPFIIFVTAYDQYALDAFEKNSIDFLLKPVSRSRFTVAMEKVQRILGSDAAVRAVDTAGRAYDFVNSRTGKVPVHTADGIELIRLEQLTAIKAEEKYTRFYLDDGGSLLSDYTLTELEQRFPRQLLRVHRNTLVNCARIVKLTRLFSAHYRVKLDDGSLHDVSKRNIEAVKECLLE